MDMKNGSFEICPLGNLSVYLKQMQVSSFTSKIGTVNQDAIRGFHDKQICQIWQIWNAIVKNNHNLNIIDNAYLR